MRTQIQALEQAYDYWEKFQFDIIAAKVRRYFPLGFPKGRGGEGKGRRGEGRGKGEGLHGVLMSTVAADVGFWSVRTMAGEILCPEVGRDPPGTNTFSTSHQHITRPLGRRTLQPCRIIELQSQTDATRETDMIRRRGVERQGRKLQRLI